MGAALGECVMPPPPRTTCKVPGCNEPAHVYPSADRPIAYCAKHMKRRKSKQREGFQTMTGEMQDVLTHMRAMKQQGWAFVELTYPLAHGITIRGLIDRDWILESPGEDGVRYRITGRGLKALQAYEKKAQRRDGICPCCGEREKHIRSSGARDAYCLPCLREKAREKRTQGKITGNPNRPCSMCKTNPRHQYSSGRYSTYCHDCEKKRARRKNKKRRRELRESIRNGGPIPLCKECKEKPRRVFANSVSSWCADCGPKVMRKYKMQRALQRQGIA